MCGVLVVCGLCGVCAVCVCVNSKYVCMHGCILILAHNRMMHVMVVPLQEIWVCLQSMCVCVCWAIISSVGQSMFS